MSREPLSLILAMLEHRLNAFLTDDDVSGWSACERRALETAGLLKAGHTHSVFCDGCELACHSEVQRRRQPDGSSHAFVVCTERNDIGLIPVAPERLRTWNPGLAGIAHILAGRLETGSRAVTVIPDRLWNLGFIDTGSAKVSILLARGLNRDDQSELVKAIEQQRRGRDAVVLVTAYPKMDAAAVYVCLDEVLRLNEKGLQVDLTAIHQAVESLIRAPQVPPAASHPFLFRKGVDHWTIVYDGVPVDPPLKSTKGLEYTAYLLAHPGEPIHVLRLIREVDGVVLLPDELLSKLSEEQLAEMDLSRGGLSHAGEIMDSGYEAECRKHLKEAIERKKLAEQRDDAEGIRLAQRDIAHFRRALSEGVGKGGRRRKMGDPAEKARSSITQAIGLLRKKLKIQHPKFHEHLAGSLFTGTHCTYSPSSSIDWRF